jgi:hypothetical protein
MRSSRTSHRAVILAVVAFAADLHGQQTSTLTGTVRDAIQAVIEAAVVRGTNINTGETFSGISTSAGVYTIPLIKPVDYNLLAEAQGFKQFQRTGVHLETAATLRLDFTLEVGTVSDLSFGTAP